jgi:ATP-binding cassette subfamily C protein
VTALLKPSLFRLAAALAADAYGVLGFRLLLLFGFTLASAICEGLVLAMLLPLFATLGLSTAGGSESVITSAVERVFAWFNIAISTAAIGGLMLILLAAASTVFLVQSYLATRLQARYVAHWQCRLFAAITETSWPFLRRQQGADIIGALSTESLRLGGAFYQLNLIVTSATFLAMQIAIAAVIAPAVTLAMLLLAVFLFLVTQQILRRALALGGELSVANADLLAAGGETMAAMKLIKATAREALARGRIARQVERIERLSFRNAFDVQIVRAIFEYASAATLMILLFGAPLLLGVDVVSVLIVIAIFVRLFPKVTGLRQCVQSIGLALPAYDTLRGIVKKAAAAREGSDAAHGPTRSGPADIRLQHASIRGEAGEPVLDQVNLDIPAGSFVAIVGPTGAGKTTTVDCVLGLVSPGSGEVLVDGVPLSSIGLQRWRGAVGYLGQDPILFSGTLRDNILWGRTGCDDAAVIEALRAADASFVLRLPQGLETDVRQCGSRLSGGERQRIALARALLGTPRLLILDEATSALDIETERNIIDALRARRGKTTIIAITHRLALVRNADQVVMMERGRVVEQGSFAWLQAARGRFAAFCQAELDEPESGPGLAAVS